MNASSISNVYWANFFGIPEEQLFQVPLQIVPHHQDLVDYHGAYSLFRENRAIVSLPGKSTGELQALLETLPTPVTPDSLAAALATKARRIVGPAWIGYATAVPPPIHPARALIESDAPALQTLRDACNATEWDHGGSSIDQPCSGVFVEGVLAAVAGHEIWGHTIAHLSIVTHPAYRGHGSGRSAVAHLARRALAEGLLPQYRTLEANHASMRIGASLEFAKYAVSLAVRF